MPSICVTSTASPLGSLSLLDKAFPLTAVLMFVYLKSSPANGGLLAVPFISGNTSSLSVAIAVAPKLSVIV